MTLHPLVGHRFSGDELGRAAERLGAACAEAEEFHQAMSSGGYDDPGDGANAGMILALCRDDCGDAAIGERDG